MSKLQSKLQLSFSFGVTIRGVPHSHIVIDMLALINRKILFRGYT